MDKLIMNDEVFGSEEMPDGGDVGRVTRRKGDGVLNAECARQALLEIRVEGTLP